MNLLHRYVFSSVLITSIGSILMFAFILLMGNVVKDMLSLLAEGQLTFMGFFKLISVLFPFVFVHALPMGLLTGILLTMGRLSSQNEITSMRAAGLSIFRLSSSVLAFAVFGTALALIVNFYYGPIAKTNYRRELANTVKVNPLGFIVEKTFVKDFPGYTVYVSKKDGSNLEDLWIWKLDDEDRVKEFIRAEHGYFEYEEEETSLRLTVRNAQVEKRNRDDPENFSNSNATRPFQFGKTSRLLSLERILGRATFQRKLKWMTFNELREEMVKQKTLAENAQLDEEREQAIEKRFKAQMAFHEKFSMGFSVLSFAILAIPMGIRAQRKETSANLFIALGLAIAYYFLMMGIGWLDAKPQYRPDLLYWLPNFLCQGIGIFLFVRADRGSRSTQASE